MEEFSNRLFLDLINDQWEHKKDNRLDSSSINENYKSDNSFVTETSSTNDEKSIYNKEENKFEDELLNDEQKSHLKNKIKSLSNNGLNKVKYEFKKSLLSILGINSKITLK